MYQTFKRFLTVIAVMLVGISAFAQVTTSSLNGKVTDTTGEPVVGAAVIAVHNPSGTQYYAVANAEGRFAINGMRPGGPYTVKVSYIGYESKEVKDITLQLGQTYNLPVSLSENAQELGEVVVSAKATKFTNLKTGAATNIDNTQIQNMLQKHQVKMKRKMQPLLTIRHLPQKQELKHLQQELPRIQRKQVPKKLRQETQQPGQRKNSIK